MNMVRRRMLNSNTWSILFLCLTFVFACTKEVNENLAFTDKFQEDVLAVLSGSNDSTINIGEITSFSWSKMYVFKPYTPINEINSALGFNWREAESTLVDQSDEFNLLVFTNGENVVSYSRVPRNFGDFSRIKSRGPFSTDKSTFLVRKEIYGDQEWIFLYQD